MSDTGKQSPLGVNALGSLLQNIGLVLNPPTVGLVGTSHDRPSYSFGSICGSTCLRLLTYAIRDGWVRHGPCLTDITYHDLIAIGTGIAPALGNAKPTTFTWAGPADAGTSTSEAAQSISWNPYKLTNPYSEITSWGYVRCLALQAWDEFNFNSTMGITGEYKDFLSSFMTCYGFVEYSNAAILAEIGRAHV